MSLPGPNEILAIVHRPLVEAGEIHQKFWDERIACVTANAPNASAEGLNAIADVLAQSAQKDFALLREELSFMLTRTNIIIATSTVLFAIIALKSSTNKSAWATVASSFSLAAMVSTAAAFVISIAVLRPDWDKAWGKPYNVRYHWTLFPVSSFEKWVLYCWLSERLTPVITKYKKAHAVAIPLLVTAACLAAPGIGINMLLR